MSKILLETGDSIAQATPQPRISFGGFASGSRVWAFRRGDWNPAVIEKIWEPTQGKPRFSVTDLNTKTQYLTDVIMDYPTFLRDNPIVQEGVW